MISTFPRASIGRSETILRVFCRCLFASRLNFSSLCKPFIGSPRLAYFFFVHDCTLPSGITVIATVMRCASFLFHLDFGTSSSRSWRFQPCDWSYFCGLLVFWWGPWSDSRWSGCKLSYYACWVFVKLESSAIIMRKARKLPIIFEIWLWRIVL